MSETEQPIRETHVRRQCLCVLIEGRVGDPARILNPCAATTDNPDSPMCLICVNSGHENREHVPYVEVLAARQEGRAYR